MSLAILNIATIFNCVKASEISNINIISRGECGNLLIYNGILIKTYYTEYTTNNMSYPAYCLDKTKTGVSDSLNYSVSIEDSIKDVKLWRILVNGYPYKTIEELGCQTREEAFSATKQAIYCYIHGNNPDDYIGIGEAGNRTLQALKTIVNNANISSDTILSNEIKINSENEDFLIDSLDKNYVSKIYYISSKAQMQNYKINLNGTLPEGIKITNLENEEKSEFDANEKFKIIIPIINLKDDGKFNINVETKTNTKPIIYGKAPDSSYQDYALTGFAYEDSIKNMEDIYNKNKTTIKIIKQDFETSEKISNVEFEILNDKKETIYSNLETDENGEIEVSGIMPGKYYIQETEAKDGYVKDEELYEINISLNETVNIIINNSKEPEKIKTEQPKQTQEIVIKKLPKTGM